MRFPIQTIHFKHFVKDEGPTSTNGQHIWYQPLNYPVDFPLYGGQDSGAYNSGDEKQVTAPTDTVTVDPAATPGTQICQRIFFDHAAWNVTVGGYGQPVCATVQGPPATCVGVSVSPGFFDPVDPYTLTEWR
jgi:hypothetical protein